MSNNLPPVLEKKLINRNTLLTNSDRSLNMSNSTHHDTAAHRRTLVVSSGIKIQGTLEDIETLVVEGVVETSMIKTKKLLIQRNGTFRGEVDSQDVEITGILEGNIVAQGNLTVTATGRLLGKAKCRRLKVEDGGQITGQIEMITADKLKQPTTPSEPSQPTTEKSDTSLADTLLNTSDTSETL
ncbi:bactofilin family protein [Commensalibacter oyaizuii]|uniref:Polymer-forming cytoskeletal protein n=1 Tax=Commensalibacter oyaizuii TaxID=3043873 RepID=A0ABT6Q1X4_9PROT|nr:polymer-forming cytoskeletal protein [Commensalibacter sp. TBRC 16381]MDI2090978.1 polymer-forming cytoskeletal protein [Commensalibacter sp. TBRC 16381]